MKVSTIDEIKAMSPDTVIEAFSGILTGLYTPKTGESDDGKWSFQNGEITQNGQKIKVVFKNREAVPQSWKGKKITLLAHHGDKGWSGVYASDNDYKNKITREIKVTPTAEITEGAAPVGGSAQAAPASNGSAPASTSAPHNQFEAGVFGGTVGMAIKEACVVVNAQEIDPITQGDAYYKAVWTIASHLIRVSRILEQGKLAPSPLVKKPAPVQQEAPPPPPPAPPAGEVTDGSDVPY